MKRTGICLGLCMAVLLVLIETSAAAPASENQSSGPFVDHILHSWRGFATNDQESHVLRMSVESTNTIDPELVRKLMGANVSMEEIYSQVSRERGEATSKGYLRIGKAMVDADAVLAGARNITVGKQGTYELANMKMNPSGNYTIIDSDVADLGYSEQNSTAKIVGHLTVNAADLDPGSRVELSEGQLTMNGGPFPGKYRVLLETQYHMATISNASRGANPPDQEDLLEQADMPSMNAGQSESLGNEKIVVIRKGNYMPSTNASQSERMGNEKIMLVRVKENQMPSTSAGQEQALI